MDYGQKMEKERAGEDAELSIEALKEAFAEFGQTFADEISDDIPPEVKDLILRWHGAGNDLAGVIPPRKLPGMDERAAQGKARPKKRHGLERGRKL